MSYEAWGEPDGRPWPRRVDRLPACMGGAWCPVRETCARYHQAGNRHVPAERLCRPNSSELWQPIFVSPVQTAEHHALALIHRSQDPMTPAQFNALHAHAQNVVARSKAGEDIDDFTLDWAEALLAQNPKPVQTQTAEKEQTWP